MHETTSGRFNVAIGALTLDKNSIGSENVALGYGSLGYNLTGNNNIAIGSYSLSNNIDGNNNIVIGNSAMNVNTSSQNNIIIGNKAGSYLNGNNQLIIENSDSLNSLIQGDFIGNKVGINRAKADLDANPATFQVNGNASKNTAGNWLSHSDQRLKKEITSLESKEILDKVLNMRGVTYYWNDTQTGTNRPKDLQYGFVAQELQKVFPEKVKTDGQGYLMAAYGDFDPMLVEAIKALNTKIEKLQAERDGLQSRLEKIEALLSIVKPGN